MSTEQYPAPTSEGAAQYFPNLHGVRGLAACMVVVCHTESMLERLGLPSLHSWPQIKLLGTMGVDAFFCLSGFLITYLLCKELTATGTVRVGRFYVRRALRIWPLYYLVLLLALTVLPPLASTRLFVDPFHSDLGTLIALYSLMLPNVALAFFGSVRFLGPLWSIGVEEQFYAVWPVVGRLLGKRGFVSVCIAGIVALVALRLAFPSLAGAAVAEGWAHSDTLRKLETLLGLCRFECMMCGGLAAVALFHAVPHRPVSRVFSWCSWIAVLVVVLSGFDQPVVGPTIRGALFSAWICGLAAGGSSPLPLEGRLFRTLGQMSYGIYLFHMVPLVVLLPLLPSRWAISAPLLFHGLAYAVAFGVTLGLARISYVGFESRALMLKRRFAVVPSRGVES